jgi:hypothetical protein
VTGDAPTPSLGMLAAAITDLASKVEALEARSSEPGSPGHLEGRIRALETVLTDVRKAVTKLVRRKAVEDAQQELRRPWHMLTSEQAEQRWLELRAWVDWFVIRTNIGPKEIPDCWYLHGGLVDELEALRWAWIETNKPDARGVDPIWWREAVHRARTRWPLFNPNGCGTTHTETRPRVMAAEREWEMFLSEELANHPAAQPARAS